MTLFIYISKHFGVTLDIKVLEKDNVQRKFMHTLKDLPTPLMQNFKSLRKAVSKTLEVFPEIQSAEIIYMEDNPLVHMQGAIIFDWLQSFIPDRIVITSMKENDHLNEVIDRIIDEYIVPVHGLTKKFFGEHPSRETMYYRNWCYQQTDEQKEARKKYHRDYYQVRKARGNGKSKK